MNQSLSAQVLTRKPLPLHGACTGPLALSDSEWGSKRVEGEGVKQARGPVINLFQNETYLKQIAANAASEAGSRPGIDKVHCKMQQTATCFLAIQKSE